MGRTENVQRVAAPPAAVYRAFVEPREMVQWLAPDGMTGQIHDFDARVGGGYEMSLFYAPTVRGAQGKTAHLEDRFTATFLELEPPVRLVQSFRFHTSDPSLQGEMTMIVTLAGEGDGTEVRMVFENIPSGIRPEDNEAGAASSLRKLAGLLENAIDRESRMQPGTRDYNAAQAPADREICDLLAQEIDRGLPEAENRIWHAHPVWFLDDNPVVGYSKLKGSVRLLFWSGRSFDEPGLKDEGTFKAAEARYTSVADVDVAELARWLGKARDIQWDYRNLIRRKGRLERLK